MRSPLALGRVLGLDRAQEVKTIRRKIITVAAKNRCEKIMASMAARQVARLDEANPDLTAGSYVDVHVRAY